MNKNVKAGSGGKPQLRLGGFTRFESDRGIIKEYKLDETDPKKPIEVPQRDWLFVGRLLKSTDTRPTLLAKLVSIFSQNSGQEVRVVFYEKGGNVVEIDEQPAPKSV